MSKFRYRELKSVALGPKLGEGAGRKVYLCKLNTDFVVKVETVGRSFQNVVEWDTWHWVMPGFHELSQWFAPCHFISNCGLMLVQSRVEPVRMADLPAKLPAFLGDLKQENFGMLNGKFVCCDYGTIDVIRRTDRRMVKAVWR